MSSLPASIKRIGSKTTKKRLRHHNIPIENLIRPQGHVTPKWLIRSSQNSNSSEILWLSWLPASLTNIRSKMNELAWRHHFPIISLWKIFKRSRAANSIVSCLIWLKVKLVRDFMHVPVTCKYKKNRIKNNWEKVETSYVYLKFNSPTRACNSEVTDSIQLELELVWDFMAVLVTSKFDEDLIKNERASLETPFSHYKSMGNF